MKDDEEGKDMALQQDVVIKNKEASKRKSLINAIANKACDRHEEALKKLAKS